MLTRILASVLMIGVTAHAALAEGRSYLGFGNLLVNDAIGDGKDRWRSGSYGTSRVWGYGWDGALPEAAGDILELRLGGEVIAPESITNPAPSDRPFAGMLSAGVHTHFQRSGTEFALGGDLVAIGPMTKLDEFQNAIHNLIGIDPSSPEVRAMQIPNTWRVRGVAEMGREMQVGGQTRLRPFVEARAGDESLVRAGFDVTIGNFGEGELLVRDWVTGHRYRTIRNHQAGWSLVAGADVAHVFDSVYLPEARGYELEDMRSRVRAGVHWRGEKHHVFYGLTWLSEEFAAQEGSQLVGAIKLDFKF
ncbi:lipid A-modifier LpxR family protein [Shimia sp. MMG029]|uniref:lipid A-modifier LpxR family protein n=1 Tax=Shimia sp. MMG029 TaxID=3021978 RepID=UPI0022FF193D|nr:lipid A-modifier LpxR family protein [Shimia sp. MMG029]MDA5557198.1 DUF2219 family protein [Shimia sp. MMG029]